MKKWLLLIMLLLAACSEKNEIQEHDARVASDQDSSTDVIETTSDGTDVYDSEDPYVNEVNNDVALILAEVQRRVTQHEAFNGHVEKQFKLSSDEETTMSTYQVDYNMQTKDFDNPYENVYHAKMNGTLHEFPNDEYVWERYYFPENVMYNMYTDEGQNFWYATDLTDTEAPHDLFYMPPAIALENLQTIADSAVITTHNAEQGYMEIRFDLTPDSYYGFMSEFLLDPIDIDTGMFNDFVFEFVEDETAYIYLYINTYNLLPNAYMTLFNMYSEDIGLTAEMMHTYTFDFDTPVEDIIVPKEILNATE